MTNQDDFTLPNELLEQVAEQGLDYFSSLPPPSVPTDRSPTQPTSFIAQGGDEADQRKT